MDWIQSVEHGWAKAGDAALYAPRIETSILVRAGAVSVIGPLARARRKSITRPGPYVRLELRPGHARAILGSLAELVDRIVPLADVWGEAVDATPDDLASLLAALAARARPAPRLGPVLARLGATDLANEIGVTERHLRRLFHDEIGLAPKHCARIARARHVLRSPDVPLRELALDAGYADQAHMTREVRTLLGATPAALRRR